jgi:hypothetical protein
LAPDFKTIADFQRARHDRVGSLCC